MRRYALQQDMPDIEIVLDAQRAAGRRSGRSDRATYYWADYIFGVNDAILVTQWFRQVPTACYGYLLVDRALRLRV
jgi:hypothetical protein